MPSTDNEIRETFAKMFPLVPEQDLPWAICHVQNFLAKRIEFEIKEQTQHFTGSIVRVLCEVTHPKTHVVDMVRAVVEMAKSYRTLRDRILIDVDETLKALEQGKTPDFKEHLVNLRKRVVNP